MLKRWRPQVEQVERTPRLFEVEDPAQARSVAAELMQPEAVVVVELARLPEAQQAAFRSFLDGVAYALHLATDRLTSTRFEYRNGRKSATITE